MQLLLTRINSALRRNSKEKVDEKQEFGDLEMIKKLSPESSGFKTELKFVVLTLAFACLVIGLVNPKIGTKSETIKREGIDIVFAIDISKSMLAEDVAPNRLEKSKQIVKLNLKDKRGDEIALHADDKDMYTAINKLALQLDRYLSRRKNKRIKKRFISVF